ncbi:MutS family DNA mismatch repair protein [Clostridium thermarum]|uniref:MutS family DNA mismatch repair protein n=1 Tax=Clostridium thermarum TaxID=1716543 RepID=UPI00111F4996|nr:MutS family DNA mismatch repair protein [Clostridium thermarum]
MNKGIDYYIETKEKNEKICTELKSEISQIGYLRLVDFIIGVVVSAYIYSLNQYVIFSIVAVIWIGVFIYLVKLHERAIERKNYAEALVTINKRGIERVQGGWNKFEDDGSEFIDEDHPYSGDLDIVGHSSLFQWINTTATYMGRLKLKDYLLNPLKDVSEIKRRQETVKELSQEVETRQKINAEAMLIRDKSKDPEELLQWAGTNDVQMDSIWIKLIVNGLTLAFFTIVFLLIFTELISYKYILAIIALNIVVLTAANKKLSGSLDTIHKYKDGIKIYERIIKIIEDKEFASQAVKDLKKGFYTDTGKKASEVIGELKTISDLIADRRNMGYIIVNLALLWDFRIASMLYKWKCQYGRYLKNWLEIIAEVEALASLSNISFENEEWCFPEVHEGVSLLKAQNLGHPLLGHRRVSNDFTIKDQGSVIFITGSNMSGKSTFLRTVGINLVMSYCGAPVCASSFSAAIMDVYTCMRVSDNLEKSISSFYAEILRIKKIVSASKQNSKIFFLLDEIFKGTNSIDRHQGATVLIKQLSRRGASGMVSTHDLELGELEKEMPKVANYHFQEHYDNGKLNFDYKLRKGISATRNAMHIIRLAGIEVE